MAKDEKNSSLKKHPGCLSLIILYGISMFIVHFALIAPEETKNFTGVVARHFYIAVFPQSGKNVKQIPQLINLTQLNSGTYNHAGKTFLLPEKKLLNSDVEVEILEDHRNWQLVALKYSDMEISCSVYRAYPDRIEPVSYKQTTNIVLIVFAMGLSAVVCLVYSIIFFVFNRLRQRKQNV